MSNITEPSSSQAKDITENLMTVSDVAKFLRLSRDKVYRMVHRGEIPYIRLGTRSLRFKKQKIEEWLTITNVTPNETTSKTL